MRESGAENSQSLATMPAAHSQVGCSDAPQPWRVHRLRPCWEILSHKGTPGTPSFKLQSTTALQLPRVARTARAMPGCRGAAPSSRLLGARRTTPSGVGGLPLGTRCSSSLGGWRTVWWDPDAFGGGPGALVPVVPAQVGPVGGASGPDAARKEEAASVGALVAPPPPAQDGAYAAAARCRRPLLEDSPDGIPAGDGYR